MQNYSATNKVHHAHVRAILAEDRTTQVTHLAAEALRRFRPAGGSTDYHVAAKTLATALTHQTGVVPTAALVRSVLLQTLGTDRASGAIAAWMRGFMAPEL